MASMDRPRIGLPRQPRLPSRRSPPDRYARPSRQGPTPMLITNLLPLLANYSLGFDLVAGPDDTVTLTVIPRKAEGAKHSLESGETRPISITATAAEIDAELGRGSDPPLPQPI